MAYMNKDVFLECSLCGKKFHAIQAGNCLDEKIFDAVLTYFSKDQNRHCPDCAEEIAGKERAGKHRLQHLAFERSLPERCRK